jgi:rRNA processing protein Gar1
MNHHGIIADDLLTASRYAHVEESVAKPLSTSIGNLRNSNDYVENLNSLTKLVGGTSVQDENEIDLEDSSDEADDSSTDDSAEKDVVDIPDDISDDIEGIDSMLAAIETPLQTVHETSWEQVPLPSLAGPFIAVDAEIQSLGEILNVQDGSAGKKKSPGIANDIAGTSRDAKSPIVLTIVVKGTSHLLIDVGTVVCFPDRRCLGVIEEVFGPVVSPLYMLRVKTGNDLTKDQIQKAIKSAKRHHSLKSKTNALSLLADDYGDTDDEIAESNEIPIDPCANYIRPEDLIIGTPIFVVSGLITSILPDSIRKQFPKGSDASNLWDEEIPLEEVEFSDDEAETVAKKERKSKSKQLH